MFQQYRDLILEMAVKHEELDALLVQYDKLEQDIAHFEHEYGVGLGFSPPEVVKMKLDRLEVKREIQRILENISGDCERGV